MPNGTRAADATRLRTLVHTGRIDVRDVPEHRRTDRVVSLGIVPLGTATDLRALVWWPMPSETG